MSVGLGRWTEDQQFDAGVAKNVIAPHLFRELTVRSVPTMLVVGRLNSKWNVSSGIVGGDREWIQAVLFDRMLSRDNEATEPCRLRLVLRSRWPVPVARPG